MIQFRSNVQSMEENLEIVWERLNWFFETNPALVCACGALPSTKFGPRGYHSISDLVKKRAEDMRRSRRLHRQRASDDFLPTKKNVVRNVPGSSDSNASSKAVKDRMHGAHTTRLRKAESSRRYLIT